MREETLQEKLDKLASLERLEPTVFKTDNLVAYASAPTEPEIDNLKISCFTCLRTFFCLPKSSHSTEKTGLLEDTNRQTTFRNSNP